MALSPDDPFLVELEALDRELPPDQNRAKKKFRAYMPEDVEKIRKTIEWGFATGRTNARIAKLLDVKVAKRGPNLKDPHHSVANVSRYAEDLGLKRPQHGSVTELSGTSTDQLN